MIRSLTKDIENACLEKYMGNTETRHQIRDMLVATAENVRSFNGGACPDCVDPWVCCPEGACRVSCNDNLAMLQKLPSELLNAMLAEIQRLLQARG